MTTAPAPPRLAAGDMAGRLTLPFARGADHLPLSITGQTIRPYHFVAHQGRSGVKPEPLYILQARKEVPAGTTVTFRTRNGQEVRVPLPDGLLPGTSRALPPVADLLDTITSPLPGGQEEWWQLTALLGTMAKLLWAIGWERDHLRHQLGRTVAQRALKESRGRNLDRHGAGLAVVRGSGETDDAYRRRVALARRWTLPTPAGLLAELNTAVGRIGGYDAPLVLDDANGELLRGLLTLRVVPAQVASGHSIDAAGQTGVGLTTSGEEGYFDPLFLVKLDPKIVDIAPAPGYFVPPGEARPNPGLVQPTVAAATHRLADLLSGRVRVNSGYHPGADDARKTGRAVLLTHPTVEPARLAALAHRAGFDLVTHRTDGEVYAECAPGELLTVHSTQWSVAVGHQLTLTVRPALPARSQLRWYVVHCGPGRGRVTPSTGGTPASFTGEQAGRVLVIAELRHGPHTVTASRQLVVYPETLPGDKAIGADGTVNPPPPRPGKPLDLVFLAHHDHPAHVDYGTDPNHHRMRREAAVRLDALIALIKDEPGRLVVHQAYEPTGTGLAREGRALRLGHTALPTGQLAARAHRAGFSHVRAEGGLVTALQEQELPLTVTAPELTDGVLEVGTSVGLAVTPTQEEVGESGVLVWSTGDGAASVQSTGPTTVVVRGERPGRAWVQASYRIGREPAAHQVEVRLRPELADHSLEPAKRELIMNLLSDLHPLGVEVVTRKLTGGSL
ncbi:hypothetical protein [Streptomyces sp. 891-h]|uniref:hypothetical protein n=1 Tax=Streptomyces sp. 891-h TaxID=2720714 RepID=UPI001FAA60CB|nr:hypothetical protein [Streptomyces sp. 891-h]UNZ21171.1 hypothetical protein HC362_32940 [Streptomyces sp. 891-h]